MNEIHCTRLQPPDNNAIAKWFAARVMGDVVGCIVQVYCIRFSHRKPIHCIPWAVRKNLGVFFQDVALEGEIPFKRGRAQCNHSSYLPSIGNWQWLVHSLSEDFLRIIALQNVFQILGFPAPLEVVVYPEVNERFLGWPLKTNANSVFRLQFCSLPFYFMAITLPYLVRFI